MLVTLASDILDDARGTYLNDPDAVTYTNTKLLPQLKNAYGFMECELETNGCQPKNEEDTLVIAAGKEEYDPLPADFLLPVLMYERLAGSSDEFRPMAYVRNIPQRSPTSFLEYWSWRVDRIFFLAAQTDREAKLVYQRSFPKLNSPNDVLLSTLGAQYLSAKTAALALLFLAQSPTLANEANKIAEGQLEDLINKYVKVMQLEPQRRLPYVPYRAR